MSTAVDRELQRSVASAATGDEVAFARIVAAHHEDMRRVCAFMAHDEALAEGHEAYDGLFAHLFSTTDPDCTACLTLTGGIFDGPVPWEPKPLEPTAE